MRPPECSDSSGRASGRKGPRDGAHRLDADTPLRRILNQKALDVIGRWHFTPARRNGTLVASEIMVAFQFGSN